MTAIPSEPSSENRRRAGPVPPQPSAARRVGGSVRNRLHAAPSPNRSAARRVGGSAWNLSPREDLGRFQPGNDYVIADAKLTLPRLRVEQCEREEYVFTNARAFIFCISQIYRANAERLKQIPRLAQMSRKIFWQNHPGPTEFHAERGRSKSRARPTKLSAHAICLQNNDATSGKHQTTRQSVSHPRANTQEAFLPSGIAPSHCTRSQPRSTSMY